MATAGSSKLVLASGSPRRAQILDDAGLSFEVVPADIDEDEVLSQAMDLSAGVEALALAKATSVSAKMPGRHVVAADTIVVFDGEILGKPESDDEASKMLASLSGRKHDVLTGIAVIDPSGEPHTDHVVSYVSFRNLGSDSIAKYVASGSPFDKAGGYGIQDREFAPVASYDGCYLNVVGLPMCATSRLLKISGISLEDSVTCEGHIRSESGGAADTRSSRSLR